MSDYIGITEAQSNPFAPFTSELVKQLRDNPIAIAEGAEGAPRLYLGAIERLEAGDQIRSRRDAGFSLEAGQSLTRLSIGLVQSGSIRASIRKDSGFGDVSIVRVRNDTEVTLASTTSNITITADVSVIPGDILDLRGQGGAASMTGSNARFSTNGQDLWQFGGPLEGNRAAT